MIRENLIWVWETTLKAFMGNGPWLGSSDDESIERSRAWPS